MHNNTVYCYLKIGTLQMNQNIYNKKINIADKNEKLKFSVVKIAALERYKLC